MNDVGGVHEVRDLGMLLREWRREIVAEPDPPALRSWCALQRWAASRSPLGLARR
ncbi:hypothetical protein [Amycolatopsis thermoflava]|uniref:hypothetical protein n=1 Tax=Amycolatopsis thermoflava TaxID=84480 RepID=UPI003651FDF2